MRTVLTALLVFALAHPLAAQDHQHHHHGHAGHEMRGGEFPEGWHARTDRDAPVENVRFMQHGDGFHAVTGPAAVFYNPEWQRTGEYEVSARVAQRRAPQHPESYGIVIGGSDLDAAEQRYSYFLVRGTGEYFIANRDAAERNVVVNWTAHPAIQQAGEDGRAANLLGIRVAGDEVVFTVNGTEVDRRPRSEIHTDGLFGFRVNHNLDVMIDEISR